MTVADDVIEHSVDDPVTAMQALMVAWAARERASWRLLLLR